MAANHSSKRKSIKLESIVDKLMKNKPAECDSAEVTVMSENDSDEANDEVNIMENSIAGLEKALGVNIKDEIAKGEENLDEENHDESSDDVEEVPEEIRCTACFKDVTASQICRHPVLNVLMCKKCAKYYNSSPFGCDDQGVEEQCRWCGDGGQLICCDNCNRAICQKCIKRNLGKAELKELLDADDNDTWNCYCCDDTKIRKLVKYCDKMLILIQDRKSGKVAFKNKKGSSDMNGPTQGERRNRLNSLSEDMGVPIRDSSPVKHHPPKTVNNKKGKNNAITKDKGKHSKSGGKGKTEEIMIISSSEEEKVSRKKQKQKPRKHHSDDSDDMKVTDKKRKGKAHHDVQSESESDSENDRRKGKKHKKVSKKKKSRSKKDSSSSESDDDSESESSPHQKKKKKKLLSAKEKKVKVVFRYRSKSKRGAADEDSEDEEVSEEEEENEDNFSEDKTSRRRAVSESSDDDDSSSRRNKKHKHKEKDRGKKSVNGINKKKASKARSEDSSSDEDEEEEKSSKSKTRRRRNAESADSSDEDVSKKSKDKHKGNKKDANSTTKKKISVHSSEGDVSENESKKEKQTKDESIEDKESSTEKEKETEDSKTAADEEPTQSVSDEGAGKEGEESAPDESMETDKVKDAEGNEINLEDIEKILVVEIDECSDPEKESSKDKTSEVQGDEEEAVDMKEKTKSTETLNKEEEGDGEEVVVEEEGGEKDGEEKEEEEEEEEEKEKEEEEESEEREVSIKKKQHKKLLSSSEEDVKAKRKNKKKQKKSKGSSSSEEEESEDDDSEVQKKKKKKKQGKKRKMSSSESDSESEESTKRKTNRRKQPSRSKKNIASSSEESEEEKGKRHKKKGKDSPVRKSRRTAKTDSSSEELVVKKGKGKQKGGESSKKAISSRKGKAKKVESSSNSSDSDSDRHSRGKKKLSNKSKKKVSSSDESDADFSDFIEEIEDKGRGRGKKTVAKSRTKLRRGRSRKSQTSSSEEEVSEEESEEESTDSGRKGKKSVHQKQTRRRGRKRSPVENTRAKRKRRRKKDSDSDSDVETPPKKRKGKAARRRRKGRGSDDSDSNDGEDNSPRKHGRKKIRKIMSEEKLTEETKKARRLEEERRQRLLERTKILEEEGMPLESGKINKLILEKDSTTGDAVVEVHSDLLQHLKVHQADGVKFMYNSLIESVSLWKDNNPGGGCIIAQCMGLGKTLQVIALIHTLMNNKQIKLHTALVVAPLNTVLNWQVEFDKWLTVDERLEVYILNNSKNNWQRADLLHHWHKYGGVMIMGYEMYRNLSQMKRLRSKKQKKIIQESLVDPGPQLVVCDEAHILRNDQSAVSKALNAIKTRRRIALTGTPLQNNLIEYHCMMNFVKPNLLGTQKEFRNHFVNPIQNGQCSDSTPADVRLMKHRSHILHKMLEGCVQRKDYRVLVPFLPPKHEYVICVRLSSLQQKIYRHYLDTFVFPEGISKRGLSLFSDFQALMRIWTHPVCLRLDAARKPERFEDSDSMESFIDDQDEEEESSSASSSYEEVSLADTDSSDDGGRKTRARANQRKAKNSADSDDSDSDVVEVMPTRPSSTRPGLTLNNMTPGRSGTQVDVKPNVKREEDIYVLNIEDTNAPKPIGSTRSGAAFKDNGENGNGNQENLQEEEMEWYDEFLTDDVCNDIEHSGKISLLLEILADAQAVDEKVIVFSQSLVSLDLIERTLGGGEIGGNTDDWCKGCDYFRMDGSTSVQMRQRWADIFNDEENRDARLFLISTKAGGLGINLVAANRIVVFDASWNPSHDTQSIFRAYRFGQNKPVFVYRLLAQGTMEEKIYERQITKLSLSERVVDEHQIERHFTAADLAELYNFSPDRLEEEKERPTPALPKDAVLADLINRQHPKWIVKYHEHDSLLQNVEEEELSEEERKQAWALYEAEKNSDRSAVINLQAQMRQGEQGNALQPVPTDLHNPGANTMAYMQQQAQLIRQQREQDMRRQQESQRQFQLDYLNRLLGNQYQPQPPTTIPGNNPRGAGVPHTQIPVIRTTHPPPLRHQPVPQAQRPRPPPPQQPQQPQHPIRVQIIRPPHSATGQPGSNASSVRVHFIPPSAQTAGHPLLSQYPGQAFVVRPGGTLGPLPNHYHQQRYKQARPGQIVELPTDSQNGK